MLRFKQFLLETPSVEDQLTAIKDFEQQVKKSNPTWGTFLDSGQYKGKGIPMRMPDPSGLHSLVYPNGVPTENIRVNLLNQSNFLPVNVGAAGYYYPSRNEIVISSEMNAFEKLNTLRHEAAHHWQKMAQEFSGKNAAQRMASRSPNISPSESSVPFLQQFYPEYLYTDIEVNARAIENARRAQENYRDSLTQGLKNIDVNDSEAVQELKNTLRSKAMKDALAYEQARSNQAKLKAANSSDIIKQKTAESAAAAERTTQEKIARGLAQTENEVLKNFGNIKNLGMKSLNYTSPESAVSDLAASGLEAAGIPAEAAGAAIAPFFINQSAGESMWDTMSSQEREQWNQSRKAANAGKVQDIINRPYNPSESTPARRTR